MGTAKTGKYDVYISDVTNLELEACPSPKREELLALLEEITYTDIDVKNATEIADLSDTIAKMNILTVKSHNDRLHIAAAMWAGCNILVSWNFKHLVNIKTIDGVRVIAALNNLTAIDICPPSMLLERSDFDE